MTITEKTCCLSKISLDFDFENYLSSNKKQIVIFEIDNDNQKYLLIEGENFDNILGQANENYSYSEAGYLVDVDNNFKTQVSADLLLLSNNVLSSSSTDLDTIIIHELVHMIIESGNQNCITISDDAKNIGNQIYDMTDNDNEIFTRHTVDYCKYLAQACIKYNNKYRCFSDNLSVIKNAMRFDIFEDE